MRAALTMTIRVPATIFATLAGTGILKFSIHFDQFA